MTSVTDHNQFEALSSPVDEGKVQSTLRRGKDDIKEQAFQAREGIKNKMVDLKEQVVNSETVNKAKSQIQTGLQSGIDLAKEKAGLKGKSNEEAAAILQDEATQQWETVKRKGNKQLKQAQHVVDQKLDENLTPEQRQKLNKAAKTAKQQAVRLERRAEGFSNTIVNSLLAGPRLRPLKNFIHRNHLELPAVIFASLLSVWLGLTVIRMVSSVLSPPVPEFDINSKEATMNWLKFHAGEFKDRAIDVQDTVTARAASFMANHDLEQLKNQAIDWKDIGMHKLGLAPPTWGEWMWARLTGRPISWQERVEHVIDLTKEGLTRPDILKTSGGLFNKVKNMFVHEPTLTEKASDYVDSIRDNIPGMRREGLVDGVKHTLQDGIDSLKAHIPGSEAYEAAKQAAYDAAHPSTLDQIRSGANYVKNRIIHGTQEAVHNAQDRTNEYVDKAKFKVGL